MPNTSAKLYGNPFMQYKVMARTQITRSNRRTEGQTDGRCDFNMPPKNPGAYRYWNKNEILYIIGAMSDRICHGTYMS